MTDLLARVCGLFVEPAGTRPVPRAMAAPVVAPAAGLVCRPEDATPLGSALALALEPGARVAVLAVWRPGGASAPSLRAPANRPARRLAASLSARALEATASGRVVRVALPDPPAEAAIAADRALGAAQVPVVVALAGPRCAVLDEVLASLDVLLVARSLEGGAELVDLAVAGLERLGPPARSCPVIASPIVRGLSSAGLLAPPALRGPVGSLLSAAR